MTPRIPSLASARRWILASLALGALFSLSASDRPALTSRAANGLLCPVRYQLRHPGRCPTVGPGGVMAERARNGEYTARLLPTVAVDSSIQYLPFEYLRVGSEGTDLFPSLEAARSGGPNAGRTEPGFVYLSYSDVFEGQGVTVYSTQRGYVRGGDVSRVEPLNFHGLAFSRTPDRPFGWIVSGTYAARAPGGEALTDRWLPRLSVVQIYDTVRVGEWDWYRVGPDEWVEQRLVGKVDPDPTPPDGVDGSRWITVNLYEQTVAAYDSGRLVYATIASTGRYGAWTKPGLFQIWAKLERDNMTGGLPGPDGGYYLLEDVPWVMYFDQARALHGTYWHAKFGTQTSRGCVNLTPADARWFFDFSEEGTWVYVWDPSGNTPTDPALYGEGGA